MSEQDDHLRELVAEVAAAYFSNSHVSASDIPLVISQIASSLGGVAGGGEPAAEEAPAEAAPAKLSGAQVKKSITADAAVTA